MARTSIHFEEKRTELLNRIWDIFLEHGYEHTTLELMIRELGVSKGAFYHYFPTKEACADAAVQMFSQTCYEKVNALDDPAMPAERRFRQLILACAGLYAQSGKDMKDIDSPANAVFHQKLMASVVRTMAPLFERVIAQGVGEGAFATEYPLETAQMLLTLTNFYLDADVFGWEPESMTRKILALEALLTAALGAKPGTFAFFHGLDS